VRGYAFAFVKARRIFLSRFSAAFEKEPSKGLERPR